MFVHKLCVRIWALPAHHVYTCWLFSSRSKTRPLRRGKLVISPPVSSLPITCLGYMDSTVACRRPLEQVNSSKNNSSNSSLKQRPQQQERHYLAAGNGRFVETMRPTPQIVLGKPIR